MILLRIRVDGQTREHRVEKGHATLGSGPRATIRHTNAGWPTLAGTLVQSGLAAQLIVPGRVGRVTLRVGDELRIGRAEVALIGLLPPAGAPSASPTDDGAGGVTSAAAPGLAFGEYDQVAPTAAGGGAPTQAPPTPAPPTPGAPTRGAPAPPREAAVAPFGRRGDFGRDLYEQLRRAPWYLCSVGLHLLLFLLFVLLTTRVPPPDSLGGPQGRFAVLTPPAEEQADRGPDPEESSAPEPLPPIEPLETPDPETAEETPTPDEPIPLTSSLFPDDAPVPDLGTQPSLASSGRRVAPRKPRPAPAPKIDLAQPVAKASARDANRKAAQHLRDQLGIDGGGEGQALSRLTADDVLVVEGEFDHQERVLDALRIPYRLISPHAPEIFSGAAFRRPRYVFWNCGHGLAPRATALVAPHVRSYVEAGGYLFTSDWVVGHVLRQAFPGYVDTSGLRGQLPEMVIDIAPTRAGAAHPLLQGVFTSGVTGRWWLEQQSYDILVKKPAEVTVLIESPQLRELAHRSAAMAITFEPGKGRVLHLLGHYYQEEGNLAGVIAAQRLALNFLLLGLAQEGR